MEADLFAPGRAALAVFSSWSRSPEIPMGEIELDILSSQEMFKTNNLDKIGSTKIELKSLIISQG